MLCHGIFQTLRSHTFISSFERVNITIQINCDSSDRFDGIEKMETTIKRRTFSVRSVRMPEPKSFEVKIGEGRVNPVLNQ